MTHGGVPGGNNGCYIFNIYFLFIGQGLDKVIDVFNAMKNPPQSPFTKGGRKDSPLFKRGVGGILNTAIMTNS